MGCQASAPAVMSARKAGKVARRFVLTIGLLCSKSFDDAIFPELFEARYGLAREDIVKMNIKGVFQVWTRDGVLHEVPLKEAYPWTREGCNHCPDFAAEHADLSTGGIGAFPDWTLTMVRTDRGRELISAMHAAGAIEVRSAFDDDPGAVALLRKLSRVSRRRWPEDGEPAPGGSRSQAPEAKAPGGPYAPSSRARARHCVEHFRGEETGEDVALARVVGAEQRAGACHLQVALSTWGALFVRRQWQLESVREAHSLAP